MKDLTWEAIILGACIIIAADMININVTVNVTDKPIITTVDTAENVVDYNLEKK